MIELSTGYSADETVAISLHGYGLDRFHHHRILVKLIFNNPALTEDPRLHIQIIPFYRSSCFNPLFFFFFFFFELCNDPTISNPKEVKFSVYHYLCFLYAKPTDSNLFHEHRKATEIDTYKDK